MKEEDHKSDLGDEDNEQEQNLQMILELSKFVNQQRQRMDDKIKKDNSHDNIKIDKNFSKAIDLLSKQNNKDFGQVLEEWKSSMESEFEEEKSI